MASHTLHMCLDIRGAMRWPKRMLKGLIKIDGRPATPEESWEYLADELAKGHRVLPMCKCEGFDFQTGCPGRPSDTSCDNPAKG